MLVDRALTSRQARSLKRSLMEMGDWIGIDIDEHGGDPILFEDRGDWFELSRLPPSTWRQDVFWRCRLLDAVEDLVEDIENGSDPEPRCPAEEVVLRLAIEDTRSRSRTPTGYGPWDDVLNNLFQDLDVDIILWPGAEDGALEDPRIVKKFGPSNYRPEAWFEWFGNVSPRPPRHPAEIGA